MNYLNFILIFVLYIGSANALPMRNSKIYGGDELFAADVISETDGKKLLVKSSVVPTSLGDLFFIHAENGASEDMNVDGSVTPITFTIEAESGPSAMNLVVNELRFEALDSNIKIGNFLGINSELSNGILVTVTSASESFSFLPITNTFEFESHFAFGAGGKFNLVFDSPNDALTTTFSPSNPFILLKNTADKIEIIIRDNLTTVARLNAIAFGFKNDD